jgi:hypothetical protein
MDKVNLSGAITCARYAFAPNFYHYCGPDRSRELAGYVNENLADPGLVENLAKFETLYPYLQAIAVANGIKDPLSPKVVEAYWVGNNLLEQMSQPHIYQALTLGQQLSKRMGKKDLNLLLKKIDRHVCLHHAFHVLNVFNQTGHRMIAETTETMDQCRISWGEVINNFKFEILNQFSSYKFLINSQRLIYKNGKLILKTAIREAIVVEEQLANKLKPGDYVSVHWGMVCERLNDNQIKQLEKYTLQAIRLANETI